MLVIVYVAPVEGDFAVNKCRGTFSALLLLYGTKAVLGLLTGGRFVRSGSSIGCKMTLLGPFPVPARKGLLGRDAELGLLEPKVCVDGVSGGSFD